LNFFAARIKLALAVVRALRRPHQTGFGRADARLLVARIGLAGALVGTSPRFGLPRGRFGRAWPAARRAAVSTSMASHRSGGDGWPALIAAYVDGLPDE
jgi:hypothetical protein